MHSRKVDRFSVIPAQLFGRPKISLIVAPKIIIGRFFNCEITTRDVINDKTGRDSLLIQRIRITGQGMGFARLCLAFSPTDMLHLPQFKQVTQLGRIQNVICLDGDAFSCKGALQRHRLNGICMGGDLNRLVLIEDL
ncbi:hypothetical protein SDC9_86472 [bioreactor metagenome]|uniref:Uncharacterized protein n=1 Tax=bioreactor metagenome TaxID=1076179 RepID=A0A644ZG68_9ZZZZ